MRSTIGLTPLSLTLHTDTQTPARTRTPFAPIDFAVIPFRRSVGRSVGQPRESVRHLSDCLMRFRPTTLARSSLLRRAVPLGHAGEGAHALITHRFVPSLSQAKKEQASRPHDHGAARSSVCFLGDFRL